MEEEQVLDVSNESQGVLDSSNESDEDEKIAALAHMEVAVSMDCGSTYSIEVPTDLTLRQIQTEVKSTVNKGIFSLYDFLTTLHRRRTV